MYRCNYPNCTGCYCDVPMTVYYGPGYTQEDSLLAIQRSLQRMADTLTCICRRLG